MRTFVFMGASFLIIADDWQCHRGNAIPPQNPPVALAIRSNSRKLSSLFDNLECGALAVARGGAVQQGANCLNGLPVATNNSTDVALSKLQLEDNCPPARNFRQHHVVWKLHQ